MDGRPPVNVGVTSSGDIFGGTAVTFSDVLGDQQFSLYAASISQYRTLSFSYLNLAHRFNYALQALLADAVLLRQPGERLLRPVVLRHHRSRSVDRDANVRGGSIFGIWPLNRYRRLELFGGVLQYQRELQRSRRSRLLARSTSRTSSAVRSSDRAPSSRSASTSSRRPPIFREFGPLSGNTVRAGVRVRAEDRQHAVATDGGRRCPLLPRLGASGLLALRARASRAGVNRPTSCTSAATPRCAATSTCSSSATRRRS